MQGILTVCHVDLGGGEIITKLAAIDNIICKGRYRTPGIQIVGIRLLYVGFHCKANAIASDWTWR